MNRTRLMQRTAKVLSFAAALFLCSLSMPAQFLAPAPSNSNGLNEPRPITTDPAILYPADREIVVMPGDSMSVSIYGGTAPIVTGERVGLDGTVRIPLAGVLHLGGLTLQKAEAAIAARMDELQMFKDPQVTITLLEAPGHVATVIGEVRGIFPVAAPKRLFDALAFSGALTTSISPVISIERPGVADPIVVNIGSDPLHSAAANIPIFAGDTITVSGVGAYYVIGAVKTPGVFKLNGVLPTTAMQALALAGGGQFQSKLNSTKLIRTLGSQRSVVEIPLRRILDGKEPDPILQSNDILFIPSNKAKAFLVAGGAATVFGLLFSALAITRY